MSSRMLLALLAGAVCFTTVSIGVARADECDDLWVERNSIYKQNRYCFKTDRAIDYFGNDGCRYNSESSIPLSDRQRNRISRIVQRERNLGCRG